MGITKQEEQEKVVCFNCRKIINKKDAFYIIFFDTYYCPKCYLKLLNGEPVRKTIWQKRGV
jgi:ssDNA-binding Zn-finger/Zn-ribbon topoisomerase 1